MTIIAVRYSANIELLNADSIDTTHVSHIAGDPVCPCVHVSSGGISNALYSPVHERNAHHESDLQRVGQEHQHWFGSVLCACVCICMCRQTDRQIRQIRHTDTQTHRQTDKQTDKSDKSDRQIRQTKTKKDTQRHINP
jgi:uncharacterized protein (UPF0305 family)